MTDRIIEWFLRITTAVLLVILFGALIGYGLAFGLAYGTKSAREWGLVKSTFSPSHWPKDIRMRSHPNRGAMDA